MNCGPAARTSESYPSLRPSGSDRRVWRLLSRRVRCFPAASIHVDACCVGDYLLLCPARRSLPDNGIVRVVPWWCRTGYPGAGELSPPERARMQPDTADREARRNCSFKRREPRGRAFRIGMRPRAELYCPPSIVAAEEGWSQDPRPKASSYPHRRGVHRRTPRKRLPRRREPAGRMPRLPRRMP